MLGIISRYINKQYKLYTHLLSLTEMPESHTEINFIERVFATTESFKTSERIDFVISNNTNNISNCIKTIETSFQAVKIDWTKQYYRIRYFVYIIYLTVTVFFFSYNNAPEDSNDSETWRQFVCFGKLYNIIKWIRASPGRNNR